MFFGEYDFNSTYQVEYVPKILKRPYCVKELDISNNCFKDLVDNDDCLVLKDEDIRKTSDTYCPPHGVDYKDAINMIKKEHPTVGKKYFKKPLNTEPIEYKIEYKPKSYYQVDYCKRGFCYSRNIVDKIDFGIKLDKTHPLPDTSTQDAHRNPASIAMRGIEPTKSMRPIRDVALQKKTEEILGTKCGDTTYDMSHSLLGKAVLNFKPYGEPRNKPDCDRWGYPVLGGYIYNIRQDYLSTGSPPWTIEDMKSGIEPQVYKARPRRWPVFVEPKVENPMCHPHLRKFDRSVTTGFKKIEPEPPSFKFELGQKRKIEMKWPNTEYADTINKFGKKRLMGKVNMGPKRKFYGRKKTKFVF